MGAPTYTLISETVLGSAQASVTFNTFPSTYKDLVLEFAGTANAASGFVVELNGDTGTTYSLTRLIGDGSTASSTRDTNASGGANIGYQNTAQSITVVQFFSYANTNFNKTFISRSGVADARTMTAVGLWRSTTAITSIRIYNGGTFSSGSTFRLWGVLG